MINGMDETRASLADIAKVAGISSMAVSLALRNRPGVSSRTREKVHAIAQRLGYSPDARIASWMARMRDSKQKSLIPITWLNSNSAEDAWRNYNFLSPYLEGAQKRAHQLGYRIEELWTARPGLNMKRVAQILDQRGVEGVIISHPARHVRVNWSRLAAVSIDGALMSPGIHRVMADNAFNLVTALKSVRRLGYRRIGICLTEQIDRYSLHITRAVVSHFISQQPPSQRVKPLFYLEISEAPNRHHITSWLKRTRPDVIVGLDNHLIRWANSAGFRVPEDLGVVHLAIDDDAKDWAGIHSDKRDVGASAVERVVSLMQNHMFGLPLNAQTTFIRGKWKNGTTVRPQRG